MVELKNVSKSYGAVKALENISFKVDRGEVVGLLGPNGAGKSTTLKITSGYIVPDGGSVIFDGKRIVHNDVEFKRKIGYLPETNPLYKDFLCCEALQFAADLHKLDKLRKKQSIEFVVEAAGIQKVFYRPISELSKGFRQRVGIAVALVHDPDILILDEPTEGLDPIQRKEIRKLIIELGRQKTVLISTHVMQEVEAMCDRIIIINNGRIVADDKKENLLSNTVNFSEGLIRFTFSSSQIQEHQVRSFFEGLVSSIDISKEGVNNFSVSVKTSKSTDFIEALNKFIRSSNDFMIISLSQQKSSLEEVFSELTKKVG